MPALFFNNLWMLTGLAALSVPVLIHLLLRRRKKRLRFSTIQFFLAREEQSSRRRKLRHWLLLALRLLICALLVLAFARPYFQTAATAGAMGQKRQALFVLDRSLSMQASAGNSANWTSAKAAIRKVLETLGVNDRAALIGCAVQSDVLSEWAPPAAVLKVLNDLQPTYGTARLNDGLRQCTRLLASGDLKAASTVYLISDLQRSSVQNLATAPLPRETQVKVLKVGDLVSPNLAVTDLQLETDTAVPPHAVVTSFSDEETRNLALEVQLDGQITSPRTMRLGAGESTNIEFSLPPLKPGWHDVTVRLNGHDALPMDDARYRSVYVPKPFRVAAVETQAGRRSFEQDTFFLTAALNPNSDGTNGVDFLCEKVTPDELAARLATQTTASSYDLVLLPALQHVPSALGTALSSFVNGGGGVLFFVGPQLSANHYNAEFGQLLPARLGESEAAADAEVGWRIGAYDREAPPLVAFNAPHSGDLTLTRFIKRIQFAPGDGTTVMARFEDGIPLLVNRALGKGRVLLVNASADTSWSDWPKHKTFVPWLNETARFLARAKSNEPPAKPIQPIAGEPMDLAIGQSAAKGEFVLQGPFGQSEKLMTDEQGTLRDLSFPAPGIYALRDRNGTELRRIAVNVPPEESDLTMLAGGEVEQQIVRVSEPSRAPVLAGLLGTGSNQREIWRVLLLSVVVLLFLELIVSNRTVA